MKRFLTCLVIILIAGAAVASAADARRVVVLTYNIHHGEGTDAKFDLERIATILRAASPDLAAVQEVDRKTQRSGGVDLAEELARLTGLRMVFGRTINYAGGQYGNAVLSRLPVGRFENHALPFTEGREPRAVLEVEVAVPLGDDDATSILFFATHLDHTSDPKDRLAAAAFINNLVEAKPDRPMLLAGDLNATPDSRVIEILRKAWRPVGEGQTLLTSPAGDPERQIDYILYRPAGRWKVIEVRVLDEPAASDHRPIRAVLELRPANVATPGRE